MAVAVEQELRPLTAVRYDNPTRSSNQPITTQGPGNNKPVTGQFSTMGQTSSPASRHSDTFSFGFPA